MMACEGFPPRMSRNLLNGLQSSDVLQKMVFPFPIPKLPTTTLLICFVLLELFEEVRHPIALCSL
jgi:hypothetical protein